MLFNNFQKREKFLIFYQSTPTCLKPKRNSNVNVQNQDVMLNIVIVIHMDNFVELIVIALNVLINNPAKTCKTFIKIKDVNAPNLVAWKTIVNAFRKDSFVVVNVVVKIVKTHQ